MAPDIALIYRMILKYEFFVHDYKVINNIAYIRLATKHIKEPMQYIKLEPRDKK